MPETPDFGLCIACRWWDGYTADVGGWGCCALAEANQQRQPDGRAQLAMGTGADSDYGAGLLTSPDFGCVMWQGKPDV